jgi:high-affinity iron transporter
MFASFLLALREGLEAALIIGIVLGALHKMNRSQFSPVIWRGVISAVVVSLLAGLALNAVGAELEGKAEEIFEGAAMLLAAGILTWMIFWMRRQAGTLKQELETNVRRAAMKTGGRALFALAFLAVAREGFELVLFLVAARLASDALGTLIGAIVGLAAAAGLGWILFASTRRLNLKRFFQVTNVLLILFAAGLVAHGVHEFNEAGVIPSVVEHVWDINPILPDKLPAGLLLSALFGYNGNPSLTEILAYLGYFALLALGIQRFSRPSYSTQPVGD